MGNKAILLAGGEGKRLKPLTVHKTKPTRKVCGVPMCVRVLENLEEAGVDEVHAAVDYRATDFKGSIKRHYMGSDKRKIDVHFHEPSTKRGWKEGDSEPEFRGIADAVRWLSDELTDVDNFIIASGDHVHNLSLGDAMEKHNWLRKSYGTQVTIIGYRKPKEDIVQRFGHFSHDRNGVITRFSEKPETIDRVFSNNASTGIYIASKEFLKYLVDLVEAAEQAAKRQRKEMKPIDIGYNIFGGILLESGLMGSHVFGDEFFWSDVGTLDDYRKVNLEVAQGIRGIRNPYNYDRRTNTAYGKNVEVDGVVRDSVIGDGVRIVENSLVSGSVIGDNAHVYGTKVTDSIIGDRARVNGAKGMSLVALGEGVRLNYGRTITRDGLKPGEYRIIDPFIIVSDMKTVDRNLTYMLNF